jgi:hypothetical protein
MGNLFPGRKRFTARGERGQIISQWDAATLNWKAKVVCAECNNTWMSEIENKHARPIMTRFILGSQEVRITQSCARSIAVYAFKTAVVLDHLRRNSSPFFSEPTRRRFKELLAIPFNVRMWLAGFLLIGKGRVRTVYHDGATPDGSPLGLYVCTYAIGHLAFQVVAAKQARFSRFSPISEKFRHLAVPIWRRVPDGVVWPPTDVLRTRHDFVEFSNRWAKLKVPD